MGSFFKTMKKLFLISLLFLSGCATNYDAPSQSVNSYREQPGIVEKIQTQESIKKETVETVKPVIQEKQKAVVNEVDLSNNNTYINVDGNEVHSPAYASSVPSGASAICGDGTYSFSQNRRGTCSHHGGVSEWLN